MRPARHHLVDRHGRQLGGDPRADLERQVIEPHRLQPLVRRGHEARDGVHPVLLAEHDELRARGVVDDPVEAGAGEGAVADLDRVDVLLE